MLVLTAILSGWIRELTSLHPAVFCRMLADDLMAGVEQLDGMAIQEVEDLQKQAVSITAQYVEGIAA
eukprot:7665701-Alexandrium_andersonii.AAC.1